LSQDNELPTKVTTFGWGRLGPFENLSNKLQKVDLTVVDENECLHVHENFNKTSQICARGVGDTCPVSKLKVYIKIHFNHF
jgi:Trypsin